MRKEKLSGGSKKENASSVSFIRAILYEAADFKGWEYIFQVLLYGFIIWAVYNLKILYEFHNDEKWAHVPKYSVYDFKYSLIFVSVFLAYKHLCKYLFYDFVKNRLCEKKFKTEEALVAKALIGANWIGQMIYYTGSSITAYILFKDQDFFPKVLGGKGDSANLFSSLPGHTDIPYGIEFYMVQFACHLHTLIDYAVYKWNNPTFWEMFLHHSLAVFLIFFSYATNNIAVGILVLFVHDPCDVLLYINRLLSDSKYKSIPLKATIYCTLVVGWIFLRLFAFPKCIIKAAFDFCNSADSGIMYSPYMFMTLMLTALLILHLYWLFMILRILVNMLMGKTNYNDYDNKKKKAEEKISEAKSS